MPKATLTFKLPEEQEEYKLATKGSDANCVIHEIDNFLRSHIKYEEHTDQELEIYESIRQKLWDALREYGVEI